MSCRSSIVAIALAAGVLTACNDSEKGKPAPSPAPPATPSSAIVVDGTVRLDALQATLNAFLARPMAERTAVIARADHQLERALWTVSGLEDALGGPQAADAAFADHSRAMVTWARQLAGRQVTFVRARQSDTPTIGMGLFGGLMVVTLGSEGIVKSSNEFKDGQKESGTIGSDTTIAASLDHAELSMDSSYESAGVTTRLRIAIEVNPCPDASGQFKGRARVGVSSTRTGGSVGQNGTLEVSVTGQVNDEAALARSDAEYHMEWAEFAGGRGSYVDVSGAMGDTRVRGATVRRTGGAPNDALQTMATTTAALYAVMARLAITDAAQKGWTSGRCVTLTAAAAPGPRGLEPTATSKISAMPRSRLDGAKTGGSVTATLTAGTQSVAPAATKVPADAAFTYTAPGEKNKTGRVSLEARSRRGVANASIDFDTSAAQAYHFVGGLQDFQVSQDVCDIMKPFTLDGHVGVAEFSGGLTGRYTAKGLFDATYAGTYVISLPNGPGQPGSMAATSSGTTAGFAGSGTEKYVLTPLASCR